MKIKTLNLIAYLIASFLVQQVSAIGISPTRSTFDLLEYNCTFNSNISYTLNRPSSTRYSMFTVYDAAGMTGSITGCSASNSCQYINNKNILIDWQSAELASTSHITATINVQSPQFWDCPAVPGGDVFMPDLVRHSDASVSGSGISIGVAAVSQLALYRNYAPRPYVTSYQDTLNIGQSGNFVFRLEDKQFVWFSPYPDKNYNGGPWLSYSIDWEGDGIIDTIGNTTFDKNPVPYPGYPGLWKWTSGIQASTIALNHIYNAAGDYSAIVKVWDARESTTLGVPVHVIPEPTTILLIGLGGIFMRKKYL